ncbi:MAG: two-component system response regulator [Candidatus Chloroheliales bacterium]|nr:MAG: two-component system response regulator [Chloroflexota bacterium]
MAKVLVAEDESDIRMLTSYCLRYGGFEVVEAADGLEAVTLAERERPDVILLDVRMPNMDGLTACKMIKANPQLANIPIAFISALGQDAEIESGREAGAVAYILKPYEPDKLIALMREIIAEHGKR